MNRDLITFRSITPAQRAQRQLRHGGVETTLTRTPRYLETLGCGYGLLLSTEKRQQALLLLQDAGIPFERVFTQNHGIWEEVPL